MVKILRNGEVCEEELANLRASVGWPYTPGTYPRSLPKQYAYFTARDAAELVGYVSVISDGVGDAFLIDLMVRPSHQGRRIGSRLVHSALSFVRDRGIQCTQVTFDARLTEFYRKAGFHIFGGGIIDFPRMEIPALKQ